MFKLSGDKATQESQVMDRFLEGFNSWEDRRIENCQQLPENDHDFAATIGSVAGHIQLTELVDRAYRTPISRETYEAGLGTPWIYDKPRSIPDHLDEEARDSALKNVILAKLGKRYTRPPHGFLWLVIFTTAHYLTAFMRDGVLQESEGLKRARQALASIEDLPFHEVWFTNLQTRPIGIWPLR
jgi:hypothetical protein